MYSYSFAYKVIRSAFFLLWLALAVGLICLVCELMWPAEFAAFVGVVSLAAVVPVGGRKASQLDLFGVNDTPLWSGAPVRVKDDVFVPDRKDEEGQQDSFMDIPIPEVTVPSSVMRAIDYILDDEPSLEELESWMMDGICEATDGCTVEPDGICEHGCESWLLVMGLI